MDFDGYVSEHHYTYSGVSQGSNLAPLEFFIMVNDLPKVVSHTLCLLFADDLKLFQQIKEQLGYKKFQKDIDSIYKLILTNKLTFNVNKCLVMTYSKFKIPVLYDYTECRELNACKESWSTNGTRTNFS